MSKRLSTIVRQTLVLCFWAIIANSVRLSAQEETLIPRPSGYALGVGVGLANVWGDLNKHIPELGERIGLARHLTNSLLIGIEYYGGTLSSEETPNKWTTGLKSTSSFYSIDLNAKVNLSVLFSNTETPFSRFMSGFYIGSGIGYVSSAINSITETLNTFKPLDTSLKKGIKKQDAQLYLPLNIGYRYKLKNFLGTHQTQVMINLNMCYTYSDYIDGYNLSAISNANKNNRFNDVFSVLTVGFSFALSKEAGAVNQHVSPNKKQHSPRSESTKSPEKKKESITVPEFNKSIID